MKTHRCTYYVNPETLQKLMLQHFFSFSQFSNKEKIIKKDKKRQGKWEENDVLPNSNKMATFE